MRKGAILAYLGPDSGLKLGLLAYYLFDTLVTISDEASLVEMRSARVCLMGSP